MKSVKKKKTKSIFRIINDEIHLWLGLISGIIVFIVSITGCFYAFEREIKDAIEPWRFVEQENKLFVPPSVLIDTAAVYMPNYTPTGLTYANKNGAAAVGYSYMVDNKPNFSVVFMNPYSGKFIKKQHTMGANEFDFFTFIINGHKSLWLPEKIGRPIVGIGTLLFIVLLISGIVMWWPKRWNKANLNKSFKIKWKASFKRVNYDLHNVLGFYSLILAFIIAVTGLVWSFQWFANTVYYLTSGGDLMATHSHPHSNLKNIEFKPNDSIPAIDKAWYKVVTKEPDFQGMYITPTLYEEDDSYEIIAYQSDKTYYNRNEYYFDQYTLELYRNKADRYEEADFADQLYMLNYDIHIGAVLGLTGKIIAFLISLICASLPITGFLVWWNKRK